jgi:hypothetical protein
MFVILPPQTSWRKYNECAIPFHTTTYDNTAMTEIFHPLLALIASATDNQLAKYVEYLKEENKILRARFPCQIHTTLEERARLVKLPRPKIHTHV